MKSVAAVKELMAREGFLASAMVIPLIDDPSRALFIGKYGLRFFNDLDSFCDFLGRISPATQDWYTYRNVDLAAANLTDFDQSTTSWLPRANRERGELKALLHRLKVDVPADKVPADLAGDFGWMGDGNNLGLVARCADCWAEVFLADRVD